MSVIRYLTHPDYTVQPPPGFAKALRLGTVSQSFLRLAWMAARELGRIPTLEEVRAYKAVRTGRMFHGPD